jgi:hypothetical protein
MLEYVLEQLDASKGQLPTIATASGVPYRTLQKISFRTVKDPGVSTVQKLYDYFRAADAA